MTLRVDAGGVEWWFAFAEPAIVAQYDVDAGDVSWSFEFVEPSAVARPWTGSYVSRYKGTDGKWYRLRGANEIDLPTVVVDADAPRFYRSHIDLPTAINRFNAEIDAINADLEEDYREYLLKVPPEDVPPDGYGVDKVPLVPPQPDPQPPPPVSRRYLRHPRPDDEGRYPSIVVPELYSVPDPESPPCKGPAKN